MHFYHEKDPLSEKVAFTKQLPSDYRRRKPRKGFKKSHGGAGCLSVVKHNHFVWNEVAVKVGLSTEKCGQKNST
jgi:hypothetical protein